MCGLPGQLDSLSNGKGIDPSRQFFLRQIVTAGFQKLQTPQTISAINQKHADTGVCVSLHKNSSTSNLTKKQDIQPPIITHSISWLKRKKNSTLHNPISIALSNKPHRPPSATLQNRNCYCKKNLKKLASQAAPVIQLGGGLPHMAAPQHHQQKQQQQPKQLQQQQQRGANLWDSSK